MIGLLIVAGILIVVFGARWFTDIVAGAGLLGMIAAILNWNWEMAVVGFVIVLAAAWRMRREDAIWR